ncbi:MAG: helix-turn-helix transcriptional regulator [Oscillospiraceae bacterium]|nr:helix-turn-helix transcriptional regulator [Oscillospiraceae bacterium]
MKTIFAVRLAELRVERGMNQRQVSGDLGVSQAVLSHYENGLREPKLEFVLKLCSYYDVTSDYLLGRSDERADATTRLSDMICDKISTLEELRAQEKQIIDGLISLCKEQTET